MLFMLKAIALARRGWGTTHPNPMVGAVIAEGETVLAEGWHVRAGGSHAEVAALRQVEGKDLSQATMYVTLEPCSTVGRTGACTDAIRAAGIRHVVIGTLDPNPQHAGRAIEILRQAGITVDLAPPEVEAQCRDLNLIFNHWIVQQRPFIAGKIATTLDGRIATRTGHSKWITGTEARQDAHEWRRYFPAIAVGAGTVLADNPRLTARLEGQEEWCPVRFVFDRSLRTLTDPLPLVYKDAYAGRTILVTSSEARHEKLDTLAPQLGDVWALPAESDAAFFNAFREQCVRAEITGVFVEGGAGLLSALLQTQQLDYLLAYRAPKLLADAAAPSVFHGLSPDTVDDAVQLRDVQHATLGEDQLMRGHIVYP